ncbi:MAG: OmpA family protein, partial [Prosthecobacter sp.]|nr:OmpA family protein [Prosthecobacter sp.]
EIIIEPTMVEVVQGREITDVRVSIMNGELDRDATKLPEGLSLDSGVEFDGGWDYFVTGAPKQAGEHEVTIHAFRGEITAVPSMLRVIVKEVTKLEWVFQSQMLPLDEGKAIPSTSYTKIVNGANSLKIRWNGDAASGLEVEAIPTAAGSWRLTGTPAKAGKFKGEFVAVKKDGNEETRPFTLEVKARKTAQVASAPTAENSSPTAADKTQPQQTAVIAQEEPKKPDMASTALPAAEVASTTPSPAPAEAEKTLATPPQDATPKPEPSKNALMASNLPSDPAPPLPDEPPAPLPSQETKDEHLDVIKGSLTLQNDLEQASYEKRIVDDRMRTFLMERIEKANSHFSDADKEMLREIVTRLKNAARIATVSFDNGQTRLKPQQVDELKQALATPDVAELLANPDCQVLVVGYASNTGSHAVNIRFSQQRAKAVNEVLKAVLGRGADLCGDYGPTDLLSPDDEAGNRVVEVYAGIIQITKVEQILADGFKNDFNKRHGGR